MYVVESVDQASEKFIYELVIYELVLRLVVYRLGEFDRVWETANRICDRYEVRKGS
ncbi:MAG TPA: hypothetical protein VFF64_00240 [Candidatus Eremiobacteraceae bacterium]|nr:hypothetical protein [Candidatus Eremiobacteraceae bacterium]